MKKLYIKRNYLIKQRDKLLREIDNTRKKLRELNQQIYNLEKKE